jgi:hypothetical protein
MIWKRISASAHNCALIIVGSLPLLPFLGREGWRYAVIAICFVYHLRYRRSCLGNFITGLRNEPPISVLYCLFYTGGFATIFYSIAVPFDLLGMYVLAQALCLRTTGRTIPGYLTNWSPTYENQRRAPIGV